MIPSQLLGLVPLLEAVLNCAGGNYTDCSATANAKLTSLAAAPNDVKVNAMVARFKNMKDDIELVYTNGDDSILNIIGINVNRIFGDTGAKSKTYGSASQLVELVSRGRQRSSQA